MSPPLDPSVSPNNGDPTSLLTTLQSSMIRKLRTLKEKQAKHDSHLYFIRESLKNNVTPRGMQIRVSLQAADADRTLRKKWLNVIQTTHIKLLKLLKVHYRETSQSIGREISNLERDIRVSFDRTTFEAVHSTVKSRVETLKKRLEERKKRKLTSLLAAKPRRGNRHPRMTIRASPMNLSNTDNTTPRTVVNLTGVDLSSDEISLLSKGLKFAPTPPRINRFQLKQDLEAFGRRLRLKEFFYHSDESEDEYNPHRHRFKEKSTWNPPRNRDPALETFLRAMENDVWRLARSTTRKDNLTLAERGALTRLRTRTDIVIKPADKGSATVVMSKEAYMTEAYRQLMDHRYYRKLDEDLTQAHARLIEALIREMFENKLLDKDTAKYLAPENPRTARFYHLPKIHKQTIPVPGRPIISSNGSPTERISEYVDHHLQPIVTRTSAYLKDTTDFLRKLSLIPTLPPGCILVTLDVSSLYTNIPHNEGLAACQRALDARTPPGDPPTSYLLRMMECILTLNNFTFNGEFYLQTQGTAMGTRMAPSYANLFMSDLETRLLTWTTRRPCTWWRYIDDIFAIWEHGQESLTTFLEQINAFHPTIKFTAEYSTEKVSFLDTTVFLDGNTLYTDLYTKPTDTHQYLSPDSCHPRHCTTSIPYSQSLRLRRICSRDGDFEHRALELKGHLLCRGYKETTVDLQIQRAANIPRAQALLPNPRDRLNRTPLVTTYHPSLTNLTKMIRRHLPILHTSQRLRKVFPNPPIVAFRRPRNLRDLLVRAMITTPATSSNTGSAPCNNRRCKCCEEIVTCRSFTSKHTGRKYNIRAEITCKSKNLIYLISCRKCGTQYVGETEQTLHARMNGHRSDIRTRKTEKPVAAHFCQPDHCLGDLEVRGIEKINHGGTLKRRERESYWIFTLETLAPTGMNLEE